MFVQRGQDSCLVTRNTSGISTRLGRTIGTLLKVRRESKFPFPLATAILGFLSIFKKSLAKSSFETLNFACFSKFQMHVRPPVQMMCGPRSFCTVSTGDSDIPSSCDIKEEPAFKPVQGNPAFFRVRASWCPFHLRQHTQGP